MSEGGEGAKPQVKITRLPEASKEDMIASEAEHDARYRYRIAAHKPEDHPDTFRKNLKEGKQKVARVIDINSPDLTGHRTLEEK